jgi:hypothetical protein
MKVINGKVILEFYDNRGKLIGTVPTEKTSRVFHDALQRAFEHTISPYPDGIVTIIS